MDQLRLASCTDSIVASNHILVASRSAKELECCSHEEVKMNGGEGEAVRLECKTLYAWKEAVGPHLAAEREGLMVQESG
jgi:bifunctional dethiobiotin synthetase / adenosylmethionine---8-amino-7-oxononanoate aminotransferase